MLLDFSAFAVGALNPFFAVLADRHCEGETLATFFAKIFVKRHRKSFAAVSLASQLKHHNAAITIFNFRRLSTETESHVSDRARIMDAARVGNCSIFIL